MSLNPEPPGGVAGPNSAREPSAQENTRPRAAWQRRLLHISLALFTFEIGIFLVVFPWTQGWDINSFQSLTPTLQNLWQNPSFRGFVTGLGFVNIYIACLQVVSSFRRR